MKLSDYVIDFISRQNVGHVFMLAGGGAMHLNNSLGNHPKLKYFCCLHEQAVAVAAEAYSRVTNGLGVAMVTSGPGATNAITGVFGAWLDSTPVLFLSGQVKCSDMKRGLLVRMLGVQEADITTIVGPITKYAVTILEPETIRYALEKAVHLALTGRRGPVWIDIPLDVQAATVDVDALVGFNPDNDTVRIDNIDDNEEKIDRVVSLLNLSKRPAVLFGNGVRASQAGRILIDVVEKLGVPVLSTWLGFDLIRDDHPLYFGRPGALAPRYANFVLQNSDFLLVVGTRLDMALTAYCHENFATGAIKVMVDIDYAEICKMRTKIDLPIISDAGDFLNRLRPKLNVVHRARQEWLETCGEWRERYSLRYEQREHFAKALSVYDFSETLSDKLEPNDIVVAGSSGCAIEIFLLCLRIKEGQRCFHNRGTGAMGFALPAAIGACVASGRRIVCVDGDGGFQMNVQELAIVAALNLNIKFFVVNNGGYASIRSSQTEHFGKCTGADVNSGVHLPCLEKIAEAFGLNFVRIMDGGSLHSQIDIALQSDGPVLCEVVVVENEERVPRTKTVLSGDGTMKTSPLEDLFPFLSREELRQNMLRP